GGVRRKLNPLRENVAGKRLIVVDDSIVRGTTQRALVRMLREAGATEVHVRIPSPPYKWPCFYGIDTGTRSELLAANMTLGEIQQYLGVDSLAYLPEVMRAIGGFGGLFAFPADRYRAPGLVAPADGAGTNTLVAQATGRFNTLGIDLVAMCADDVVCQGAEPLFLLDYTAVGRLDPDQVEQLVEGVVEGCRRAGCALIGGETAEHPGAMEAGEFDLAGFVVGVAER